MAALNPLKFTRDQLVAAAMAAANYRDLDMEEFEATLDDLDSGSSLMTDVSETVALALAERNDGYGFGVVDLADGDGAVLSWIVTLSAPIPNSFDELHLSSQVFEYGNVQPERDGRDGFIDLVENVLAYGNTSMANAQAFFAA